MNAPSEPIDETDGRRLRRDRNRDAVVEALLSLYAEGNLDPSSAEIAERAGLSPRSLFRYFDDIDDLCRAAITEQQRRVLPLTFLSVDRDASLRDRIVALVEQRVALYEAIEPAATVSRLRSPFQPLLAAEVATSRGILRKQVKHVLGADLASMSPARSAAVLAAADALCSFESHQLLRHSQGLGRTKTTTTLVDALALLCGLDLDPSSGANG